MLEIIGIHFSHFSDVRFLCRTSEDDKTNQFPDVAIYEKLRRELAKRPLPVPIAHYFGAAFHALMKPNSKKNSSSPAYPSLSHVHIKKICSIFALTFRPIVFFSQNLYDPCMRLL